MTRRELREHCFKIIFCADFYPAEERSRQIIQYFESPLEEIETPEGQDEVIRLVHLEIQDDEYLRKKTIDIVNKLADFDEKINAVAEGWTTKRIGKVELTILRLALYEILYDDEVPERVAINEAVELAKKFGGDESSSFINGILAKLV